MIYRRQGPFLIYFLIDLEQVYTVWKVQDFSVIQILREIYLDNLEV